MINEIAWAGTEASTYDEWIELYNPNPFPVDLTGWLLEAEDGTPSIDLTGTIAAYGFFLLERTDDTTVYDILADLIYTGSLENSGETLRLIGPDGETVDTANIDGGAWPAGESDGRVSMERNTNAPDADSVWESNNGLVTTGQDVGGNSINGSPKEVNSVVLFPSTATPTPSQTTTSTGTPTVTSTDFATATVTPTTTSTTTLTGTITPTSTQVTARTVLINEIAWAGTEASTYDEWIELYNPHPSPVDLTGWLLEAEDGSPNIELSGTIAAYGFFLLERTDDTAVYDILADQIYTGSLENGGETLRLIGPDGETVDTANLNGGDWPAGDAEAHTSMERNANAPDADSVWESNNGLVRTGQDVDGNPINGTPKEVNSVVLFPSTATPTPTQTSTPAAEYTIWINEVAWAGTIGSYNDEWIELYNASSSRINLDGWRLFSSDGKPDIELEGFIPAHSFFLLERTDDTTVANIAADQIYSGSLSNAGETLYLYDPSGKRVDIVRQVDDEWPGGDADMRMTLERRSKTRWGTNTGYRNNGLDVDGYPIRGTPKERNSVWYPTPTPTAIPTGTNILINEFLPRPKYDWNGDGKFSSSDEFIEIVNAGSVATNLVDWILDDEDDGSSPYLLPDVEILPGETLAIFRSESGLSLSDSGDSVRLFLPDNTLVDERSYNFAKAINLSWCRDPDGIAELIFPCWPTPGRANASYPLQVVKPEPPRPPSGRGAPPLPGWQLPNNVIGYL